jgi:ribonuclease VapC
MIAVDTSALMAIVLGEPAAQSCKNALQSDPNVVISAGTLTEALIVASRRNLSEPVLRLVDELNFDVIPVTAATARRIEHAYSQWGKGVHRAALNLGDCFAYDVAKQHGCKLLYVGQDFAATDIESVL